MWAFTSCNLRMFLFNLSHLRFQQFMAQLLQNLKAKWFRAWIQECTLSIAFRLAARSSELLFRLMTLMPSHSGSRQAHFKHVDQQPVVQLSQDATLQAGSALRA